MIFCIFLIDNKSLENGKIKNELIPGSFASVAKAQRCIFPLPQTSIYVHNY